MSQAGDTVPLVEEITDQTGCTPRSPRPRAGRLLALLQRLLVSAVPRFCLRSWSDWPSSTARWCSSSWTLDKMKRPWPISTGASRFLPTFELFKRSGYRVGSVSAQ
uniref:Uncharacterized protein n=1 Tax=Macrostomum lignano TaxID=282301 RepID=A0A1I8FP79_9PLAT